MNAVELLTVSEVADRLRFTKPTVYRLINSGRLRAVRLGDGCHWRVRTDDLAAFVDRLDSNEPTHRSLRPLSA